jgi:hypothetical protein
MDYTAHLRRQAEFCLRLSQSCSDQPISRHLGFLAARYHETALRAEFGVLLDRRTDERADPAGALTVWH